MNSKTEKKLKTAVKTILFFTIFILIFTGTATAATHEISTAEQLKSIGNETYLLSDDYRLLNDITISDNIWVPIGDYVNHSAGVESFTGTFDGNGKTITFTAPTLVFDAISYFGFFGSIDNASIENLNIKANNVTNARVVGYTAVFAGKAKNSSIFNCNAQKIADDSTVSAVEGDVYTYRVGGIAGEFINSEMDRCSSNFNVKVGERGGGLVGNGSGTISNSYATGNVIYNYEDHWPTKLGGLVGYFNGTIKNSFATGNINAGNRGEAIGGLIGGVENKSAVENCYATGNVLAGISIGGLIGYAENTTIKNCYAAGDCYSSQLTGYNRLGGLIGRSHTTEIINCYAVGEISTAGSENIEKGGIIGLNRLNASTTANCYYDMETTTCTDTGNGLGLTTAQMKDSASFSGWDIGNTSLIGEEAYNKTWYTEGANYPKLSALRGTEVPENDTIVIKTPESLQRIGTGITAPDDNGGVNKLWTMDADYVIAANITVNANFEPIGTSGNPFTGNLTGSPTYMIKNLKIEKTSENVGLFGYTNDAVIQDIILENATVEGSGNVGSLIGTAENTFIERSAVMSGRITAANENAGGLIGNFESGMITDSYALAEVSASADYAGGLAGKLVDAEIYNSFAAGLISSGNEKGGISGINENGFIDICFFDSETTTCPDTGDGMPRTTAEMYDLDTFWYEGWDISEAGSSDDTIWKIESGVNYPFLNGQA